MNYRHIFHAGNFADVFKHALLALMVEYLTRKEKPFFVLDTHAGLGAYDLDSDEARRTAEADAGIGRVLAAESPPAELMPYLAIVRAMAAAGPGRRYPGSPRVARALMRPQDRLVAVELHPDDAAVLKAEFGRDRQVKVVHLDGYTALKAYVPPKERRGLVLVDPPFEKTDEFATLVDSVAEAYRKWPTGTYALWYPLKGGGQVPAFHGALANADLGDVLAVELTVALPGPDNRLSGTGLAVVNPPWLLQDQAQSLLPWLAQNLSGGKAGTWRVEWLSKKPG
ncbi:23S rRNA (adenine(2030)-N(6))-methyltransferase RlmJ [Caenispirillum bisanense]|uniref:Ribosomal RNA large subunit methyltransferase J n=1 Tax=Caenispirillum bisanense TaxID=414052 RepID=A0A286GI35_9PROT|nr:23S rRNA (adenine(2030)-N(6))-methyltransferase RlmJ [Caenispirillum bisanense]SOD95170.1 23S rRNA (adenine2030-N6)-methyltransferase [Caenispirillum bisanense]